MEPERQGPADGVAARGLKTPAKPPLEMTKRSCVQSKQQAQTYSEIWRQAQIKILLLRIDRTVSVHPFYMEPTLEIRVLNR